MMYTIMFYAPLFQNMETVNNTGAWILFRLGVDTHTYEVV